MMTYKFSQIIVLLALLSFLTACSDDSDDSTVAVPQEIISNSLDFFDGTVIEEGLEIENGIEAWEVEIQNSEGAIVIFYWAADNLTLIKIEGDKGPFTYEINPGGGLINFSTARTFAVSAVKNDALVAWELKKEEEFADDWVYEFEIADSMVDKTVYIDAMNGNVLQID
jgi:uncharacterized membrane protein YkoI